MKTDLWYTERQTPDFGITCRVHQTHHHEETPFQKIDVVETAQFGDMLVLDGMVMTTEKDEFVYHEMITHVAMNTHPNPQSVLVIGGGDGGAVREVLKHPGVKRVVLAEIDEQVVEISRKYFPSIASGLTDPRVDIHIKDGILHVQQNPGKYDVILVDSTEPVGPAKALFQEEFLVGVHRALKEDGIMVAQTESPWFNQELIRSIFRIVSYHYPITRLYTASIPTYPSGLWSFTLGSKQYDPLKTDPDSFLSLDTRYYHPQMHHSLFTLPVFVKQLLEKERVTKE